MVDVDQTRVKGTYYAVEASTGKRVVVVLWDDSPDDVLPALSAESHDDVPVRVVGVLAQAASNEPEAVSSRDVTVPDIPYDDIFMSPERSALLNGHTNVQASTLCYQAARGWTVVVGVVAKGYIPEGETAFPPSFDVQVDDVNYTIAVDIRSVWIDDDYEF